MISIKVKDFVIPIQQLKNKATGLSLSEHPLTIMDTIIIAAVMCCVGDLGNSTVDQFFDESTGTFKTQRKITDFF